MMQKLRAHQEQAPRPLAELRPDVPVDVVRVVERMMAKGPAQRYQTPAEVAQALAPFVSGTGEAPQRRKRRPVVMVAAAMLGLIGGGLLLQQIIIRIEVDKDGTVVVKKDGEQVFPPPDKKPPPDSPPPSPLDLLDPKNIPEAERLPGQPKELVAVLGERRWKGLVSPTISSDGKRIAAENSGVVYVCDLATGRETHRVDPGHPCLGFAFSPADSNLIALGSWTDPAGLTLWDLATGKSRVRVKWRLHVLGLTFNPRGTILAISSWDKSKDESKIMLWDVASQKETATVCTFQGRRAFPRVFTPDGKALIYAGADKTIRLWDVAAGKEKEPLKGHEKEVTSLAIGPDGKILAAGDKHIVWLWDLESRKQLPRLSCPEASSENLAFSPDGTTLAAGQYWWTNRGFFANIKLWDMATKEPRAVLHQRDQVAGLVFSPDGRTLFSGCEGDDVLRRWDVKTGELILPSRGHTSGVVSVAITPDSKTVASLDREGVLKVWDLATGKDRDTLVGNDKSYSHSWPPPPPLAFSPDGRTLASVTPAVRAIQLWDISSPKPKPWEKLITQTGRVASAAFSPDSKLLASAEITQVGYDPAKQPDCVKVWEVTGGKVRASLPLSVGKIVSLAFAPDNNTLALGGEDGSVRLWDVAANKERSTLPGHAGAVTCMAFSPDGQTLVTGSKDQTVRIRDLAKNREREIRHPSGVASVAFAPDGKALMWVGNDGLVVRQVLGSDARQQWQAAPGCLAADGRHLLYGTQYGTIYVLRLRGR
jgi:WD40 repeat protein